MSAHLEDDAGWGSLNQIPLAHCVTLNMALRCLSPKAAEELSVEEGASRTELGAARSKNFQRPPLFCKKFIFISPLCGHCLRGSEKSPRDNFEINGTGNFAFHLEIHPLERKRAARLMPGSGSEHRLVPAGVNKSVVMAPSALSASTLWMEPPHTQPRQGAQLLCVPWVCSKRDWGKLLSRPTPRQSVSLVLWFECPPP